MVNDFSSPGMVEIYLLILSILGCAGCMVLCRRYWIAKKWISLTAWNLVAGAWAWLAIGELLWNVIGWGEWVSRLPRASIFRVLAVAGIWVLVFAHRHRQRQRRRAGGRR